MGAVIYTRISNDHQGHGLGVARQERACRELADSLNLEVSAVYSDNDVSAYQRVHRPSYERLLGAIKNGEVTAVLCWHPDRLHRHPRELEVYIDACQLSPESVPTFSVHGSGFDLTRPEGRFAARMHGAMARRESELNSLRIRSAKLQSREAGAYDQGRRVPFGWKLDAHGRPVLDEPAAEAIRDGFRAVREGRGTTYFAAELNRRGLRTRYGNTWSYTTARQLLMRPHCAGIEVELWRRGASEAPPLALRPKVADSDIPAIVSEQEWRQVVGMLEMPERRTHHGTQVKHLLSNILECHCGSPMRAKNRAGAWSYCCVETARATSQGNRDRVARHCQRRADPVDRHVMTRLRDMLAGGELPLRLELHSPADAERESLVERLTTLRDQQSKLALLVTDPDFPLPVEQFAVLNTDLNRKITLLRHQGERRRSAPAVVRREVTSDAAELYLVALELEARRALVRAALVVTCRPSRNNRTPVEEVIDISARSGVSDQGTLRGRRGRRNDFLPDILTNEVGRMHLG